MEAAAGIGIVGWIIFAIMALLLPFSAYAGQKWANRTYLETKKLNEKLDKLLRIVESSSTSK